MTPYALPCALVAQQTRLRSHAVRSFCRQILEAMAEHSPERLHVRYWDDHVSLCYWPRNYRNTTTKISWQSGMLMETRGVRFFNELEGRVLLVRDDVAAKLADHLPALRAALHKIKEAVRGTH